MIVKMVLTIEKLNFDYSSSLRIDLKPWNAPIQIAEYGKFAIDNENEKYKLKISISFKYINSR